MTTIVRGPYEAETPRDDRPAGGWLTAEAELAAALEGQAPRLAHDVAELIGPHRAAQLAQAISRAVAVGIKRRGHLELADRLAGLEHLLFDGLNQIIECTTSEDENG